MERPPIVIIVGPTAVGKSAFAIEIARRINGEIISADSRQIFRGLTIGTGKVTKREMRGVQHHLLDIRNPRTIYTAAQFVADAQQAAQDIVSRGHIPIVCGGTGFYIDALMGRIGLAAVPANRVMRKKYETWNTEDLFAQLQREDAQRAKTIDRHNKRRMIRALEVAAGAPKARPLPPLLAVNPLWIGLTLPREELRARIRARLRERMKRGMLAEAKRLHAAGLSYRRMKELGLEYRYLALHLEGALSKEEMLTHLEAKIWQFAKRQMTYWKRNDSIQWLAPGDNDAITRHIAQLVQSNIRRGRNGTRDSRANLA